jgi:outer membrane usher protein FimD/PapC
LGEFFLILTPDNDVWIKRDDLNTARLKKGLGRDIQFEQETYVSLKSIPDLDFRINEETASLEVTAATHLFKEKAIDSAYTKPYEVVLTKDRSVFLNYALIYDYITEEPIFDVSGELGISAGNYLGISTFLYEKTEDEERALRLLTSLTYNDRKKLRTAIFGDFTGSSGALGSAVVLGGINFSKNFSIDPYLLRYPPLNLSATIETPSEVEVYLNSLLVRRETLSPGAFVFRDVPTIVGFGTANILIRDAFGRERIISTPYYYTTSLLKKGFHEYSYSIGFTREDFGVKNFNYSDAAFLGFHNFGLSDNLKIGYASEISTDVINIGPSASLLVLKAGVLDSALAFSNSRGKSGLAGFLNYTFQTKNINANFSLRSHSREYSNLAIEPSDDKAKFQFSCAFGFGWKKMGYITAEYSTSRTYTSTNISRTAVSYNKPLKRWATFFITASETKAIETTDEIFLGLHVYLGRNTGASLNYTSREGSETKKATISKSLPVGTGFGYRAEIENVDKRTNIEGNLQYQNRQGIYGLGFSNRIKDAGYRLSLSGGIGYIDNSVFLSRPINDSFAKVKVSELEGVRVYYYGNKVNRTNRKGAVIIPNMRSFHDNRIDIENRDIPIDYSIPILTQYISPPFRSGALVTFDVKKIQGITGTLYISEEGEESPVESVLMLIQIKGKTFEGLVGRDGEFYLESIPAGKHKAKIIYRGKECKFDIIIPDSEEMLLDLGKIICEAQ